MEQARFCMFSNWSGSTLHSRPMGAFVRRPEGALFFFTDARTHKDDEIARYPQVCLAFADPHGQTYVLVSGVAQTVRDRSKIEEFWALPATIWFKSPDNPNLRLLKVVPAEAEYWDAPGNLVRPQVLLALMTGGHPSHHDKHREGRAGPGEARPVLIWNGPGRGRPKF